MSTIYKIQLRRGLASEWLTVNPILGQGEPGLETDTGLMKIGDGIKTWSTLPYFAGSGVGGDGGELYIQPDEPLGDTPEPVVLWVDTDEDAGGGAGVGLQPRASVSKTTAFLAAGASESGTITLANSYRLLSITTSAPARVRLYTTTAKRDADASRPIGTDPTDDHGLQLEFVSATGLLSADLSPLVDGFDGKSTPDGIIPITITNTGTGSAAITVTFVWIRSE